MMDLPQVNSVLVTSLYEDPQIIQKCIGLKIKLLPKDMVATVPVISAEETALADVILIDDDVLLHQAWSIYLERRGIKVAAFSSIGDFLNSSFATEKNIPIYIDYHLGLFSRRS